MNRDRINWAAPLGAACLFSLAALLAPSPSLAGESQVKEAYRRVAQRGDREIRRRQLDELLAWTEGTPEVQADALKVLSLARDVPFDRSPFLPKVRAIIGRPMPPVVKQQALLALPTVGGGSDDLAAVAALTNDPSPLVRSAIAQTLFALIAQGPPPREVDEAVRKLIDDPDEEVVRQTIRSLWGRPVTPAVEQRLIELSRGSMQGGPGALAYDALYYALSTRPQVSPPVARRLIEIMQDPEAPFDTAGRAAWGLSHHEVTPEARDEVVFAVIAELDESLNPQMREQAVFGLGRMRTDEALDKLEEVAADDESEALRDAARRALWR